MKDLGWAYMVENEVHKVGQMSIEIHEMDGMVLKWDGMKDGMVSERVDDIVEMEVGGMVHVMGGANDHDILDCLQKSKN